jgi:uncharacterized integral membrane protein
MEEKNMSVFLWIAFFLLVGVAFFAVQNSDAAPVVMKFLFWRFETSLVYTVLGALCLGILLTLLIWIPRGVRTSLRTKRLRREIDSLEESHRRAGGSNDESVRSKR